MMLWFTARGAGLSALVLLSTSTASGALVSHHFAPSRRVVAEYLHRVTAALGLAVLVIHVTTVLADSYAGVGWRGALVPGLSGYRAAFVALGTLAVYTIALVAVVGALRGRFARSARGARVWRRLHALAYLAWASAMAHGLLSGTDSGLGWVRAVYLACGTGVLASLVLRVVLKRGPGLRRAGLRRSEFAAPRGSLATAGEGVRR